MAPVAPPAAMRVAEAKPAAKIGSWEGVTSLAVAPPSSVRTSAVPGSVVMTHSVSDAHEIERRLVGGMPMSLGVQVAPPSLVTRNSEPSPTAKPLFASRKKKECTARVVSLIRLHEFAPSVVR